jgi:hypothetical protein
MGHAGRGTGKPSGLEAHDSALVSAKDVMGMNR